MGNYGRDNDRGNRGSRGGFGNRDRGNKGGGFNRGGGNRGGFNRDRDRKPVELHDVVCDKCKKETQVPFKPTGDKPVLCRDCFEKSGGNRSNQDRGSRGGFNRDRGNGPQTGGVSSADFKALSEKVDKILKILENIEIEVSEGEEEKSREDSDEEDDDKESDYEDDSDEEGEEELDEDDDEEDNSE